MKRLFYIRHGETDMNVAGLLSGQIEAKLTEKGKEQAKATGREIKDICPRIDLMVCSPYERTYETARLIAGEIDYPESKILKNDLFVERTFGILEGTHGKDFLDKHEYKDFDNVEGAETVQDLQKRAEKALEYVKTLPEDNILIVGHGAFGRAIRRVTGNLPHTHEYEVFNYIDNGAIIELI